MPSATDLAYERIKAAVMSGELKAGDRVKEELLAEQIGVSRTPIRNALQKLSAQGFIEMLHHQGARVANWSSQDIGEITDLRALLESFGAGVAARKIHAGELVVLRELADDMEQAAARSNAADLEEITRLNSQFHMNIISASGNRRLAEVIGNLAHPLLVQRRFSTFSPARLQRSMDHHREIIDALSARDPEWASSIMRSHILSSANISAQEHDI
ncbi:GntR family transcriptional regulator [Fluviibacterium sp. DFM31]|uniref:GntR family transcriptional regulator n=1 Tax=Meridianimarinicoccus marinus TaxID=3231483 RepID=A0ABV3LBU9_9RHOB